MQERAARKLLHYMGQEDETEDSPESSSESDGLSSDDEADEQNAKDAKSHSDANSTESDDFHDASDQRPSEALRPQTEDELQRRKLKHLNNGGSSYSYMLSLFLSSPFGKVGVGIFAGLVMLMLFGSLIAPNVLRLPKANKFMIKMRTKQETLMFTSPTTYWHDYYLVCFCFSFDSTLGVQKLSSSHSFNCLLLCSGSIGQAWSYQCGRRRLGSHAWLYRFVVPQSFLNPSTLVLIVSCCQSAHNAGTRWPRGPNRLSSTRRASCLLVQFRAHLLSMPRRSRHRSLLSLQSRPRWWAVSLLPGSPTYSRTGCRRIGARL
jgi:hypothetical protein